MTPFDLPKISQITETFISRNRVLGYHLDKLEEDKRHVLYQAANLFSLLYCQITADIDLIVQWPDLQESLFKEERGKANRYLIYVVPDSLIKRSRLSEELTRAERDDKFFRKVFISLPDNAGKHEIESSLADRIPIWFEDRDKVIRQYVPVLGDLVPDADLLNLLLQSTPSTVVRMIEKQPRYAYLLEGKARQPSDATGLQERVSISSAGQRGPRITRLTVQNFRRFEKRSVDLDGDVVIVYGRNGSGKTTVCDALELSIFPEPRRLFGDPDIPQQVGQVYTPYIRALSAAETAFISVTGKSGGEQFCLETTVKPDATVKLLNGKAATHEEVVRFLTHNQNVHKKNFLDILLHTHFLGQHSIRDFIYGNRLDDDQKITTTRYNLLAEMFGFGEVELLKKRLTDILAQIKRKKLNDAEKRIDAARAQIRGMQQKYGPRCRQELEKRGYEIGSGSALKRYRYVMDRLVELLEAGFLKQALVEDGLPMENYQASCESVQGLLTAQVRKLEAHAVDLKRLGRLMAKINALFPDTPLLNTATVMKSTEDVRRRINQSIEIVAQAQREIQTINGKIESLNSSIAHLRRFSERYDYYRELLRTEERETETLNSMQERKSKLLQQQSDVLAKLEQATANEQSAAKLLADKMKLIRKYEQLLESLGEARVAELALQQQASRIAIIDASIAVAEHRLSHLSQQAALSSDDQSSAEVLLNWESLRSDTRFACPCCGAEYDDRTGLEQGIHRQLAQGRYRQELLSFLADLARKHAEVAKVHLLEIIRSHSQEKAELEQINRAHTRILTGFRTVANELGGRGIPSERSLRETIRKYEQEIEGLQQALAGHQANLLRDDSTKLQADLAALKYDSHQEHLATIRSEILELRRPVGDLLQGAELPSQNHIRTRLDSLSAELLDCTTRKEDLLGEIRAKGIPEETVRELDECIGELESLSLNLYAVRGYSQSTAPDLADENLHELKKCHDLSVEVEDLSKLFGLLTAQERSDTLRVAMKRYEIEKSRWAECYRGIDKINTDLSKLSYSGLQRSLAEYGPLINQIYRKFIRHDIFDALELEPHISQKARRRDLYLRLRSYSGETKYTPASYLSEAQLNILALSIFLTRVMYQNISTLETVFIDDPIQQMDDMNAAAFVDVILGLSQIGKQIIITTCNNDFYRLVVYKMHGVSSAGKTSFRTVNLDSSVDD